MNELQFGVFLSPRASDLDRLYENVRAVEDVGFDFISIQDHPYMPDFLDTFALIGTLIGRTSRIRFMSNVANLPLRPPQLLAKTSASLDLLSSGRFELGLGAGRSWPQIAGLGGPARSPAEAVTAGAIGGLAAPVRHDHRRRRAAHPGKRSAPLHHDHPVGHHRLPACPGHHPSRSPA